MKAKMQTSLTLSREVVRGIDRMAGKKRSRSAIVDDVLRGHLSHRERAAANACDVEKINRFADELRRDARCARLPIARPPLGGAMKRLATARFMCRGLFSNDVTNPRHKDKIMPWLPGAV
ncbi:MAG: hypothetical protein ACRD3D_07430 [Terriglobia bacterium]